MRAIFKGFCICLFFGFALDIQVSSWFIKLPPIKQYVRGHVVLLDLDIYIFCICYAIYCITKQKKNPHQINLLICMNLIFNDCQIFCHGVTVGFVTVYRISSIIFHLSALANGRSVSQTFTINLV